MTSTIATGTAGPAMDRATGTVTGPATSGTTVTPVRSSDAVATIAVALFSFAIAVGFARVFPGWSFLSELAVVVVTGHTLSYLFRRARLTGWIAVPVLAVGLAWLVGWLSYAATFSRLLPTSATWELARLELGVVRAQFATATAPVEYGAGWATLALIGIAAAVLLADTFAFRADARAEALVPGGVLFVFVGALGDDRLRIALTAIGVAAGYVAVVALRAHHDADRRPVLRAARGPVDLVVPAAIGSALAVALVAGVVGPRIPGAGADALYDTTGRAGGVTEVVSPLVDIRSRLVSQSDNELFLVEADADSYWRLTTLPEFDGVTFRLPTRSLERIAGTFGSARPDSTLLRQDIEIVALGGQLVPAAADAVEASGDGLRWNPDTATLVNVDGNLAAGDRFTVVSSTPRPDPSQLRSAGVTSPPDPIHLELPDDFPGSVVDLAATVTDGASSPYDAALALQSFFRTEFQYSLDVPAGHGASAIEVFLRQRIGYCEQFAAAFAAMARSVGLPSRVAVGYTAGLRGADGRFSVLGRNAHAWPEVWFDAVGWVPFEPTPGRGAPGTEQFTGVAPAQDETPAAPGEPGGGAADESDLTPPLAPQDLPMQGPEFDDDLAALFPDPALGQGGGTTSESGTDLGALRQWLLVMAVMIALVVPAVGRRLVQKRRERAPADQQVTAAWRQATHAATAAGVRVRPSMTSTQVADATAHVLPVAARPMRSLAEMISTVTFAPPSTLDLDHVGVYGETVTRNCLVWARQVEGIAADQLSLRGRVVRYVQFWR